MNRSLLTAVILALGMFGIFALVLPAFSAYQAARETRNSRQATLEEWRTAQKNLTALESQLKSRQADVARAAILLPEIKQTDQLLTSVEALTAQTGVQLKGLTVMDDVTPNAEAEYKKTLISLDLSGTYPSLVRFLEEAERSLRLYDVVEIVVSRDALNPAILNYGIKMHAYNLR